ncbi:phage tail protein [Romboutsia timonensis]|uniref:phage tail protein n=1 Tax=Romboutsia timonensis TaxID=1776391 RepID=UPI002A82BC80|nr:phage tail protein [Romboutsia timonensis]MDY3960163.1 phage tail protein [Romboutsia timonensis]
MYIVTIINNNIETIINHVSADSPDRITGTIKQGINCIDSFTFTIYHNNVGYNLINPYSTLVKVFNTKTNKYEFIGRILKHTSNMYSSGLISKSFVCESELAYLIDSTQSYKELHNITVYDYLKLMLDNHNRGVESHKQFKIGNVTVKDSNDSLYRYLAYDTTWKNINDDLIGSLGGELQIRYEGDIKYLDYLTEIGKVCDTEIRLGKNIKDISIDNDPTQFITRLKPLGAKLKTLDSEGNEVELEERLTIASVNNNIDYIDDEESIKEFGIIQGYVTWDDVTDAKNLITKGKNYLASQRVIVSNTVTALDLSILGIDIDSFEVGNYYPLVHEILGIKDTVRIVEKSINIEDPSTNTITLGDREQDIKKYNAESKKGYSEVKHIAQQANSKVNIVEKNTLSEIYRVDGRINGFIVDVNNEFTNVNNNISNSNTDLTQIKKDMINLTNRVNTNTANINAITTDLGIIKNDLTDIKSDISDIKTIITDMKVDTDKIPTLEAKIDDILKLLQPTP